MPTSDWTFLARPTLSNLSTSSTLIPRIANDADMEEIYMSGYDAWGAGFPKSDYLSLCAGSRKYSRGVWVTFDHEVDKSATSLICYTLPTISEMLVIGIGSICTKPSLRRHGFALTALRLTIDSFMENSTAEQRPSEQICDADLVGGWYSGEL